MRIHPLAKFALTVFLCGLVVLWSVAALPTVAGCIGAVLFAAVAAWCTYDLTK